MLELKSQKSARAAELAADLDRVEQTRATVEREALAGRMTADTLSRWDADRNLLRVRAEVAQREADAELDALASEKELRAAVTEFLHDDALGIDPVAGALQDLEAAALRVEAAIAERDLAVRGWAKRLQDLGVPQSGLTLDNDELMILPSSRAGGSPRIVVGGGEVNEMYAPGRYIRSVLDKHTSRETAVDFESLHRHDQRGKLTSPVAKIRMLRKIGVHTAGSIVSTRSLLPSVAAKYVHDGIAEHVEGELPEHVERSRTVFFGAANEAVAMTDVP